MDISPRAILGSSPPRLEDLRPSHGEVHFLWFFIQGSIMVPDTRARLRRAWGMCQRHSFTFLAVDAAFHHEVGAIAMGATTYRWILDHHIQSNSQQPKPWPYEQPVWVFTSRTLPTIHGTDIRFARGDVRPVHRQMITAAGDRNIWLVGGGALVGQFYDHGLLDEMIVTIVPVTLGSGASLLPRPITTPPLRLISVTARDGDPLVTLRYEVPRPWTKE